MNQKEAIDLVVELAQQNVIRKPDSPELEEERNRQLSALYTVQQMNRGPKFEIEKYVGIDGMPVIHVDTNHLTENSYGPVCRVYLNDDAVWENPSL